MAAKLKTLGSVVVTTGGTRVRLTADPIVAYAICVQAPASNAGNVYIGDETVTVGNGHEIPPGATFTLDGALAKGLDNFMLGDYYVDAATNGDSVRVSYLTQRPS